MKLSYSLFIFASCVLVLVFQIACLDAAALINEKSTMVESSGSDENDASVRNKKQANGIAPQQTIPVPLRRHHLKFGVLGKRYAYGYLGKRTEVPEFEEDFEDWLNNLRERRAGRPQYGLLG